MIKVTDHVTRSTLKKTLRFKVEGPIGCGAIQFGNFFVMKLLSHDKFYPKEGIGVKGRNWKCFRVCRIEC